MEAEPTQRFFALLDAPEADLPLDEGALLIAAHGAPGLEVESWLFRLDDLAAVAADVATPEGIAQTLFVEGGFSGNVDAYDDPRNSMLPEVIERRLGIPITLSVLMIEIGRRLGVALHGVGMPGHFLVGVDEDPRVYFDPFHAGVRLDAAACRERFSALHGSEARWDPAYLGRTGPRAILLRMLDNLAQSYGVRRDANAVWVGRLRLGFVELSNDDRRRTAALLGSLGAFAEGADALDALAASLDDDAAVEIAAQATALRARAN